jgi:hypothetical protein
VKLNDALGGLLTWKLAGEDVVRGAGVPAAVVRPTALTEEPLGAPLEVDQGDVIKVRGWGKRGRGWGEGGGKGRRGEGGQGAEEDGPRDVMKVCVA